MVKDPEYDDPDKAKPVVLTPLATPPRQGISISLMMQATAAFAVLFAIFKALGPEAVVGGFLLVIALWIGMGVFLVRLRTSRQETLLLSLAIAAERSIPLSPAALAFADQFGSQFRGRVQQLAMLLDEGTPLPKAVGSISGLMSRDSWMLSYAGWNSGRLGPALRQAASVKQSRKNIWGPLVSQLSYLTWVLIFMQGMFGFVMYFVVPKFEAIFMDFGIVLPPITIFTIQASHFLTDNGIGLALLLLAEIGFQILLPLSLLNYLEFDVPPIDYVFRRKHVGLILRSLSLTVEGGKPIESGLYLMAENYPSSFVRSRLSAAVTLVNEGSSWTSALKIVGFLTPSEVATLEAASRIGNLAWALQELADSSDRRIGYSLQFWTQMLFPFLIIGLGLVVLVVSVAYFAPLITLISRLA